MDIINQKQQEHITELVENHKYNPTLLNVKLLEVIARSVANLEEHNRMVLDFKKGEQSVPTGQTVSRKVPA